MAIIDRIGYPFILGALDTGSQHQGCSGELSCGTVLSAAQQESLIAVYRSYVTQDDEEA